MLVSRYLPASNQTQETTFNLIWMMTARHHRATHNPRKRTRTGMSGGDWRTIESVPRNFCDKWTVMFFHCTAAAIVFLILLNNNSSAMRFCFQGTLQPSPITALYRVQNYYKLHWHCTIHVSGKSSSSIIWTQCHQRMAKGELDPIILPSTLNDLIWGSLIICMLYHQQPHINGSHSPHWWWWTRSSRSPLFRTYWNTHNNTKLDSEKSSTLTEWVPRSPSEPYNVQILGSSPDNRHLEQN